MLEAMVAIGTHEYKSDFMRRIVAKSVSEGEAEMILTVLAARGIDVPDVARERIAECTDLDQLKTWGRRAAKANSIDDLFV